MNYNFYHPKLITFLIIALLSVAVLVFIFLKLPSSPPANENINCNQINLPYQNPTLPINERVADLMNRMSIAEKIGQMVLIEKNSIHSLNDITQYNLGALLSGGGAGPKQDTPSAWLQMVNDFQSAAKDTCLGIPLLYGIDAIHGHGNVLGATIFPHSIGLGATRDPDLVERVAKATAEEMAATGIYWNFAPNLDVAKDIRWGKTYETFGSDPDNVATLGTAYLKGLQNYSSNYLNVLATAKHYVGGGNMEYGTSRNKNFKVEEGNITLDEISLRQTHLIPFQKAITNGIKVVMVGTATWNGKMNTSNYYLLTDVLKEELGFSGFIVSDWYGVYAVSASKYDSIVSSINAGVDMVMTPFEYKDFISNIQEALSKGDITKERIDDAVKRILTVKFETGLFDRPQSLPEGLSVIGNDQHREIAREAVRKSQVLLKNNNSVLPLSKSLKKIIVAGSSADNLGRQAGGWTTEWQGIDGNYGILGTTILEAIKNTVSKDTKVEYNKDGNFSIKNNLADIGIIVVGEKPYAEGWGDIANPNLSPEDLLAIEKVKTKSEKIAVIIVSGRPLNIKKYTKNWDAIIAAWLPGSEGQGVTDILFGDFAFTGVLPVDWEY
ncbi:MAG TPA: beta-glucosidase [Candidatus Magasanikbacteria bacterium]|nr:beta-glucosidase [Candidatus Magasanikbacteria bacterium]